MMRIAYSRALLQPIVGSFASIARVSAGRLIGCITCAVALALGGCGTLTGERNAAVTAAETLEAPVADNYEYIIGPGDQVEIFVWRNPELSTAVAVRPDGRISVPLVEDLEASGRTASELARGIEEVLAQYVKEPLVTVIVGGFSGVYATQVRVVGEATTPQALPYSTNMTALDAMIAVGGLTEFAAGNRARLVRRTADGELEALMRLDDLLRGGDVSANVRLAPGDVIIIPESFF